MEKRVKRLAAFGVAAMLALSGCGKTENPVKEESPVITVEEVEKPEIIPETTAVPLSVNVTVNQNTYYLEDEEDTYLYLQYCDVAVEGDEYAKLKRTVEGWSVDRGEGLRSLYRAFEEAVSEKLKTEDAFYGYSLFQTVSVARADSAVLSLLEDTYQDIDDMQAMFYREGINFDSESGKKLALADLFSDYETFIEEARERIIYELKRNYGEILFDDYITTVEELWLENAEPCWYLDATGIVIIFQEYEVGPEMIGLPEIHLPYADFKPYIKEAYLPESKDSVTSFAVNQEVFVTLPDSGEEMPMMLAGEANVEDIDYSLWLGQQECPLDPYVRVSKAYIVRSGETLFCLVEVDVASDDYVTYVYELSAGGCVKVDEIGAAIDAGNINPHEILMKAKIDLLGSYGGFKTYQITENGIHTEETEYLLLENQTVLTTTADLPVTLEGRQSTLPAGSHIVLTATDGETYVNFTIWETGQNGVMEVQRNIEEYYNISINGIDQNDCFVMLPYAG